MFLLAKLLVDVAALDDLDRLALAVAVVDDLDALALLPDVADDLRRRRRSGRCSRSPRCAGRRGTSVSHSALEVGWRPLRPPRSRGSRLPCDGRLTSSSSLHVIEVGLGLDGRRRCPAGREAQLARSRRTAAIPAGGDGRRRLSGVPHALRVIAPGGSGADRLSRGRRRLAPAPGAAARRQRLRGRRRSRCSGAGRAPAPSETAYAFGYRPIRPVCDAWSRQGEQTP